jgi:hypothetical protein
MNDDLQLKLTYLFEMLGVSQPVPVYSSTCQQSYQFVIDIHLSQMGEFSNSLNLQLGG